MISGNPGHCPGPAGADPQPSSGVGVDRGEEEQARTNQERARNVSKLLIKQYPLLFNLKNNILLLPKNARRLKDLLRVSW